jgi:hypothetical protein
LCIFAAAALAGCSTFTTPRYAIDADTNMALKALNTSGIGIGDFSAPASFDANCRMAGPLAPPDGMSHAAYLRKAFEDEMKVAGVYAAGAPRVVLSANVNRLAFSSARGLTGGAWDVAMTMKSSNGATMVVDEHYEFESGFVADTACKQTAEAYFPAVQNVVKKTVRSPEFKALIR